MSVDAEHDNEIKPMICDICGKSGAHVRRISRCYDKGANLLVIENVLIVICPHCGESYLTVDTLHEIERIILHRQALTEERQKQGLKR